MSLDKDVQKGSVAKQLLENEAFTNAFDVLEKQFCDTWKLSDDQENRERLWVAIFVLGKLKRCIAIVADRGKIAKKELDDIQNKKRGILSYGR